MAAAFLLALAAAQFAFVRPTNFGGTDEWLSFSLLSRGILSFPYANRPLNLAWALPGWSLFPDRLVGFLVFHALWIGLGLTVACVLVAGLLRFEWAYWLGWVIQGAALALGFVVTTMFFLGAVFLALWATAYFLGRRIEVDRAEWFGVTEAIERINPAQAAFVERLQARFD